jgi:hypothetical protein
MLFGRISLQQFFDWSREQVDPDDPWLILGKGPTFGSRDRFDLREFKLLSLNHVVREQAVSLAHIIDLDVVNDCAEALERQAAWVVLPWYPHVKNRPGRLALPDLVARSPLLRRLDDQRRLLWYDLSTGRHRHGPGPVVQATYFSAEAAVGLLALAGVRRVRSLGVDGGVSYSADFDDLTRQTLLANGQRGFDLQFQGIARTIHATGVDFAPLDQPSPVLACVLCGERTALPSRVLEFSIRRHTSMSVRVEPVRSPGDIERAAQAKAQDWDATPSLRWRRAIVLRSGALVLDDLRKLWARPLDREVVETPRQASACGAPSADGVLVVTAADPRRLATLAEAALNTERAPAEGAALPGSAGAGTPGLPASWGRRDAFLPGMTSILHYADPTLQPWVSRAHPFAHLWVATLVDAVRSGFISLDLIRTEIGLGHVRPSLLEQVERGNPESLFLSRAARRRDVGFRPAEGPTPAQTRLPPDPAVVLRALARHARRRMGAYLHGTVWPRASR